MKTRNLLILFIGLFLAVYAIYKMGQSSGQEKAERQRQKEDLREVKEELRTYNARLSSVESDLSYFRRIRDFVKSIFGKASHSLISSH
jgi:type VI protein secretion system component VasK